jgi:fructokinase
MFTVVGEALVDLVQSRQRPGEYTAHPGGSPYNVAITLARLGRPVSLIARTGRDGFGRMLEAKARDSGVAFDRWQVVDEPTSLAVASLDPGGGATYDFYLDSTAGLGWDDSLVDLMPTSGVLHLGSIASWRRPSGPVLQGLQRRAYEGGATLISYDPNVRPALIDDADEVRTGIERCAAAAHVMKASEEDVAYLYPGEALGEVAVRWGAPLTVVTLGAEGAVAFGRDGELARCPGRAITVADTVGAGDSFAGGLLNALADAELATPQALAAAGADKIGAALDFAVTVSALTCQRAGAEPPTVERIRESLPRNGR